MSTTSDRAGILVADGAPKMPELSRAAGHHYGGGAPVPWRLIGRQAVPRVFCDVLAAAIGLIVFAHVTGRLVGTEVGFAAAYVTVAAAIDLTTLRRRGGIAEELALTLKVAVVAFALTATASFILRIDISRYLFCTVVGAMTVLRPPASYLMRRLQDPKVVPRRILLICGDAEYGEMESALKHARGSAMQVVARYHEGTSPTANTDDALLPEGASDLAQRCSELQPRQIVVGASSWADRAIVEELAAVNELGIQVRSFPRLFEEEFGRVPLVSLDTSWFLFDIGPLHNLGYRAARRLVDIAAALFAALALCAVLPLVCLANLLWSRGPTFFRQTRVGQGGKPFTIVKLRSMTPDAEASGPRFARACDDRITTVGRFLRRSRLDELPQCWNLLRGEMSLIGPRPERPEYVDRFSQAIPFYDKRHIVKPGLTGWAQIHEGYAATLQATSRKLERDLYYIKHQSLGVDIKVIGLTLLSMLRFRGQ